MKTCEKSSCGPEPPHTHLDDVVNVDLPVLVVVERLGEPLQLVFRYVLDLPHDGDQLVDADQVFPEGVEQTAYRKRRVTRWNGHELAMYDDNMLQSVSRIAPTALKTASNLIHSENHWLISVYGD